MNTHQATQEGAMDRLRADMAERDAARDAGISKLESAMDRLRVDMAKRDADMAKRDKDNTRWMIGMWVAAVVVLGAFLGTLIIWPP